MDPQFINFTKPVEELENKKANFSGSDSSFRNESSVDEFCEIPLDNFLLLDLLPSVFILLLLMFVERRQKICSFEKRFPCLSGRFGIMVPLDFTSSLENRWSYAFAFGAITPLIFSLFFGDINPFPYAPRYLKVFVYLVAALEVGVVCKPFFACLSTPNQMLGGILGLLYTLNWFVLKLWDFILCKIPRKQDDGSFTTFSQQYFWLLDIPHLLSLGFLLFRFGFIIVKDVLIRLKIIDKQKEVKKHQYRYVQRLLRGPAEVSVEKSWFQRKVYEWDPYFKFPNRIIATVVLCVLGVYMIVFFEQVMSIWCTKNIYQLPHNYMELDLPFRTDIFESLWTKHLNYITYTWYITAVCAAVSSVIHISHVLVYYRKHIKSLWAGDKKYLPKNKMNAAVSVAGLLKYPGYQIAFTMWGYLIVHVAMFTAGMVFVYLVISPISEYGFHFWLLELTNFLTNFIIVFTLMRFQRFMIKIFFLQDKNSPQDKEKPLALNNRKIFHNFNYYLFFFNMILGLGSCVLRVIRSAVVALMLLSRIERTIMPQGFKKLDASHSTWLGMIITDHYHSNPVLVCFCHLLLKHTLQSVRVDEGVKPAPPAMKRARLRWVLVYTLLRNPGLILLRKRRWHLNKEALELAFIWAMTRHRANQDTQGSGRSALTLISALHRSSFNSEPWWEGLRRTCPP
ncbi:stimulated by retinoic acid gene 6 protein-like [Hemibagrus wyckioides]|uniref:stimulated by retinoic acid gene 6 protein-like n=1 Tax=Hemibagrus wyckioides TaxID=337641 RepID=UPI00266CA7CE|nr:stimulated by retinoic acid gene 6 protein-like [Hemibagrus wyckioides]